jgi:methanogenic corrinoid protein MtbC1
VEDNKQLVFKKLRDAVINYDEEIIEDICQEVIGKKLNAKEAILEGLAKGMQRVADLYDNQEYGIPEVLLSAEVLKSGMELLKPHIKSGSESKNNKILIGTVEGDIHTIGKNIVALMLGVGGFEVIDLGEDVEPNKFIDSISNDNNIIMIALSTMMTTTLRSIENTINEVKKVFPDMNFIVGGASVTREFAKKCGADAFAENATEAVSVVKNFLNNKLKK